MQSYKVLSDWLLPTERSKWTAIKASHRSFLCQEWDGLVHTSSLCPDVALTFGTYLSQLHLDSNHMKKSLVFLA